MKIIRKITNHIVEIIIILVVLFILQQFKQEIVTFITSLSNLIPK